MVIGIAKIIDISKQQITSKSQRIDPTNQNSKNTNPNVNKYPIA